MPGEAGRAFVDAWQATNLLRAAWGDDRIASLFLLARETPDGILYNAAVVKVEDSGTWLACFDDTANDGARAPWPVRGSGRSPGTVRRPRGGGRRPPRQRAGHRLAGPLAAVLRYRAATARADAARAASATRSRRQRAPSPTGACPRPLARGGLPRIAGRRARRPGLDLAAPARCPSPRRPARPDAVRRSPRAPSRPPLQTWSATWTRPAATSSRSTWTAAGESRVRREGRPSSTWSTPGLLCPPGDMAPR